MVFQKHTYLSQLSCTIAPVQKLVSPAASYVNTRGTGLLELLHFQTLCLVWLGKRVTALKGAVSLASTQHEHKHNVQQQTIS